MYLCILTSLSKDLKSREIELLIKKLFPENRSLGSNTIKEKNRKKLTYVSREPLFYVILIFTYSKIAQRYLCPNNLFQENQKFQKNSKDCKSFCKIPKGSWKFWKIWKESKRFGKITKDCKNLQEILKDCKIVLRFGKNPNNGWIFSSFPFRKVKELVSISKLW